MPEKTDVIEEEDRYVAPEEKQAGSQTTLKEEVATAGKDQRDQPEEENIISTESLFGEQKQG